MDFYGSLDSFLLKKTRFLIFQSKNSVKISTEDTGSVVELEYALFRMEKKYTSTPMFEN